MYTAWQAGLGSWASRGHVPAICCPASYQPSALPTGEKDWARQANSGQRQLQPWLQTVAHTMSWVELGGWEVTALFLPEVAEVLHLKVRRFLSISEIRKVLGTETKTLPLISPSWEQLKLCSTTLRRFRNVIWRFKFHFKNIKVAFSGGAVDKNLPASAGDTGLILGPRRFHMPQSNQAHSHDYWAHAPQLLKPSLPRACAPNKRSHLDEKPCTEGKNSPCSLQLEKACLKQ